MYRSSIPEDSARTDSTECRLYNDWATSSVAHNFHERGPRQIPEDDHSGAARLVSEHGGVCVSARRRLNAGRHRSNALGLALDLGRRFVTTERVWIFPPALSCREILEME